jgi:hypothetical protein
MGSGTAFSATSAMPFQNTVFNYFAPSRNAAPFWTFGDTLSWTKGKHAFKFGGEARRNSVSIWDNGAGSNANPMATGRTETDTLFAQVSGIASNTPFMSGVPTVLAGTTSTGNVLAMRQMLSLLSGSVGNVTQNFYLNSPKDLQWADINSSPYRQRTTRQDEYSFFAKDDWKVRRNLTLNLGVRWDYYGVPWEANGMTTGLVGGSSAVFGYSGRSFDDWMTPGQRGDLTGFEYIGPNSPHPGTTLFPKDWNNVGPAVGFAWQVPWFGEGRLPCVELPVIYQTRTTLGASVLNRQQQAGAEHCRIMAAGVSESAGCRLPVRRDSCGHPGVSRSSSAARPLTRRALTVSIRTVTLRSEPDVSVTRSLASTTLDVRYVGTLARKQFYGTLFNLNTPNFRSNGGRNDRYGRAASPPLNNIFRGQTIAGQVLARTQARCCGRTRPSPIVWPTAIMWVRRTL